MPQDVWGVAEVAGDSRAEKEGAGEGRLGPLQGSLSPGTFQQAAFDGEMASGQREREGPWKLSLMLRNSA